MGSSVLRRLSGDDSRTAFLMLASLRSHLMRQRVLTLLTMLVIGLSVALVIALSLSSHSVEMALTRSASALRGSADLEVTAGAVGMPESLLEAISGVTGVVAAAPLIETTVRVSGGPRDGQAIRILGVDLLADQSVRSYTVIQRSLHVTDPLMLVAKSDSVILSEALVKQLGVAEGDSFTVRSSFGERPLVVRGLLAAGGVGDAYAGQVAVMDVYALQALLERQGWLDRIDLVLDPKCNAAETQAAVAAKVDGIATVRRPDPGEYGLAGAAISTLRFIANLVTLVGVLVSALLCYAAVAASVDRRTRLFALLRAAGLETRRIRRLVYLDSLAVGIAGVVVGIPLGIWLSRGLAGVFSRTSDLLEGIEIKPPSVSLLVLLLGAAVGIGVSQISAALAARRSTRLPPHAAIASGRGLYSEANSRPPGLAWISTAILLVTWLVFWVAPIPVSSTYRAAILFVLGTALLWTAVGPLLAVLLPLFRAWVERLTPGIGRVAIGSLSMRLNQTRIAVASIAALLATTSSLWILVVSLAETFDRSVSTRGGAVITANDMIDTRNSDVLKESTVRKIGETPGVSAIFRHYLAHVIYRGEDVGLNASSSKVLAERRGFDLTERVGSDLEVARALESGGVIIFDAFQRHFGVNLGDLIELDTPHGRRGFPVVGIRPTSQTGRAGGIQMDIATFDRYWSRPGVSNLIVWTSGVQQEVLDEIQRRAGGDQALFFVRGDQMDRVAQDILGRYSRLVYGLLTLVVLMAGAAVAGLLGGASKDLRADMALLQCLGASRSQLLKLVLVESSSVGLAGILAGLAMAFIFDTVLGAILSEEFGWIISWKIRPADLTLLVVGSIGTSALIGLVAAVRLQRGVEWNSLTPE